MRNVTVPAMQHGCRAKPLFHNQALVAMKVTVNICLLHLAKRTLSTLITVWVLIQHSSFP